MAPSPSVGIAATDISQKYNGDIAAKTSEFIEQKRTSQKSYVCKL